MRWIALLLLAGQAWGGEYAVLANGFRIYADRHEIRDGIALLYTKQGVTGFPAAQVCRFEAEDYAPPPPVPAAAQVAQRQPTAEELLRAAAEKAGLPPAILYSVAAAESGFREDAVSPKGAIGLMQLMPGTARGLGADPRNAAQNADAGARYLADLLLKYRNDSYQVEKALAAYNAGPGAVDRFRGVPPYWETRRYIEKVLADYSKRSESSARPARN